MRKFANSTIKPSILLVSLALVPALATAAEIYQWRDANGKLHFSDKKPNTRPAQEISASLDELNMDESTDEREKLGRLFKPEMAAERALREREARQGAQREEQHQERCDQARKHLKALQRPVYFVRDDGSSYTISEVERRQKEADLAAEIREYCA